MCTERAATRSLSPEYSSSKALSQVAELSLPIETRSPANSVLEAYRLDLLLGLDLFEGSDDLFLSESSFPLSMLRQRYKLERLHFLGKASFMHRLIVPRIVVLWRPRVQK